MGYEGSDRSAYMAFEKSIAWRMDTGMDLHRPGVCRSGTASVHTNGKLLHYQTQQVELSLALLSQQSGFGLLG